MTGVADLSWDTSSSSQVWNWDSVVLGIYDGSQIPATSRWSDGLRVFQRVFHVLKISKHSGTAH